MAATSKSDAAGGLWQSLKDSPATEKLTGEFKQLLEHQTSNLVGKASDKLTHGSDALSNIGETGKLPPLAAGAKALASGDSPVKAGFEAAKTGIADKAKGLFGKKGKGGGKSKSVNICEAIDVGVPVSEAYNQWTQFQEFGRFMKGVEGVEQTSEVESNWRVRVFKSRRSWKANIQEQVPDRRIVWTSEGAKGSTKGVVTFHPLADDLTRVLLSIEYFPHGFMEKTGNIWRAGGRRARLDLKLYQRFVMMEGEATGSWRGEIRDGQVVSDSDESDEDQQDRDQRDDEDRDDERAEGEQPDEESDGYDESDEDEGADESDEDEPEGEDEPRAEDEEVDDEADDEPADDEPEDDEPEDEDEPRAEDDEADEEPDDDEPDDEEQAEEGAKRPTRRRARAGAR